MKHITDEILNVYILNSSSLTIKKIEEIEVHLSECKDCEKYYNELKSFYSDLNNLEKSDMYSYELISLYPEIDENNTMSLAAQNDEQDKGGYKYFNTYATAEKLILIRAFRNYPTGEFNLYLICEDVEKIKNALVNIRGIDKDFISDKEGFLKIKDQSLDKQMKLNIHSPVARFEVDRDMLVKTSHELQCILKSGMKLKIKSIDNNIQAEFEVTSDFRYKKLKAIIIETTDSNEVIELEDSKFTFAKPSSDKFEIIIVEV